LKGDRLGPGDRVREANAHGGARETVGSSHCPHPTSVRLRAARGKVPRSGMFENGVPTLKGGCLRRPGGAMQLVQDQAPCIGLRQGTPAPNHALKRRVPSRLHGNVGEYDGKLLEMSDWLATRTGRWV